MKLKNIIPLAALALPLCGVGSLTSCTESDSDLVSFVEDNRLNTPNDTVYSLMGVINKMQTIADRIMEFVDGKLIDKMCTYDEYIAGQREEMLARIKG